MTGHFAASIVRLFTLSDKEVNVVGAGFLVEKKYVVTCAHVISQALKINEETKEKPAEQIVYLDFPKSSSQKKFTAHVICWHPPQPSFHLSVTSIKDIAILELDEIAPQDALATRFVTPSTHDRSGHQFYTYGFPYGYNQSVSATGQLRATELNGWMQLEVTTTTSIPIEPGFSGAPVWDKDDGGVVGMIVEVEKREGVRVAFAVPTEILIEAWPELDNYVNDALSSVEEDLTNYFQSLDAYLSKLPSYYPQGFNFDYIRQRIRMKQQVITIHTEEGEESDPLQTDEIDKISSSKESEQAYRTWMDLPQMGGSDDVEQSGTTGVNWSRMRPERRDAILRSGLDSDIAMHTETIVVDWEMIRSEVKRGVILGDPGSGKSWLLKYEGRMLVREQLAKLRRGQLRQEEVVFPIFFRLGTFAEEIAKSNINILEFIIHLLKQEYSLSEHFLFHIKRWLVGTQCALLLDGLDEVAEDRRLRMREALKQLADSSGCRILLTSRIVGYRGVPFIRHGGKWKQELELVAFAQEQIEGFIGNWFAKRVEYGLHLLSTLRAEPPLRLLAGIPLLLSFLCLATALSETIPTRRAELYETVMQLLLEAVWRSDKGHIQEELYETRLEEKYALLENIAWHFATLNGRWYDLMLAEELEEVIKKKAQEQHSDEAIFSPSTILEELTEKDAILVKVGASQRLRQKGKIPYLFLHRTFHEFLVARYLAAQPINTYLKFIRPHFWFDSDWEVVILLLAGCLEDPNPLLEALLQEQHDVFHTMLLLAGRCLTEARKPSVRKELKDTIIRRLFQLLYSPAERDRSRVLPVLGRMGESVIDELICIVQDKKCGIHLSPVNVRAAAVEIMGQINHPRTTTTLISIFQNGVEGEESDISILEEVAEALGNINNQESTETLMNAIESSNFRRRYAIQGIKKLNNSLAIEMLQKKLLEANPSWWSNRELLNALIKMDKTQVVKVLLELLRDCYKTYGWLLSLRQFIAHHLTMISDLGYRNLFLSTLREQPLTRIALEDVGEPEVDAMLEAIQHIDSSEDAYQSWQLAWDISQPDEKVVGTFLRALWLYPQQYSPILSIQEIAAWAVGQLCDSQKIDAQAAQLQIFDESYDEDFRGSVVARSAVYQGKSGAEGLLEVLENIEDHELQIYISLIRSWILLQILGMLENAKRAEDKANSLGLLVLDKLGQIGDSRVVKILIDLFRIDGKIPWSSDFRKRLFSTLGTIGDTQATKFLLEIFHDEETRDELGLINVLRELGNTGNVQAVELLLTILKNASDNDFSLVNHLIRQNAALALGQIGDTQAVEALLVAIYDEWRSVRNASAKALGEIGDARVINTLFAELRGHPLRKIFFLALEVLQQKEKIEAPPLWTSILEYREWRRITEQALITIGKQGDPRIVKALLEASRQGNRTNRHIRRVVKAVFGRISKKRDINLLMHILLDRNERITSRIYAAQLLSRIGDISVVEGLLVCSQEEQLYDTATIALERLASQCDPRLFCKRILDADRRLALDGDTRIFIYELLAQRAPQLQEAVRSDWSHWRVRLMQSMSYILFKSRRQRSIAKWSIKIVEIFSSLQRAQSGVSEYHWQGGNQDDMSFSLKDHVSYNTASTVKVDFMGTFFALIGIKESTAGWLSYFFGWVTGLIFLLLWRRNRFVRFHAIQSIMFFGPISIGETILNNYSNLYILNTIFILVTFICWILLMTFARQGKYFKLPFIGVIAMKFVGTEKFKENFDQ